MTIPTGRTRTSKAVALFLALIGSIFVSGAGALPANPQDSVRNFYDVLLSTMKNGSDPRAERALCGIGSGRQRRVRCAVHGAARGRPVLGDPDPEPSSSS